MTASRRTFHSDPDFPARRTWLTLGAALPLLFLGASIGASGAARAATAVPAAVQNLAGAAMALFDAAESGKWVEAQTALDQARTAAGSAVSDEGAYTDAGGPISKFFQARNALSGDLVEAGFALSVKDQRWLVSCADRIESRAGELADPFVRGNSRKLTLEALLFLARRIRSAAVWQDPDGLAGASADFRRLWGTLRAQLRPQSKHGSDIDAALEKIGASATSANAKSLYTAVEALSRSLG